jgi:hypothetical protein
MSIRRVGSTGEQQAVYEANDNLVHRVEDDQQRRAG